MDRTVNPDYISAGAIALGLVFLADRIYSAWSAQNGLGPYGIPLLLGVFLAVLQIIISWRNGRFFRRMLLSLAIPFLFLTVTWALVHSLPIRPESEFYSFVGVIPGILLFQPLLRISLQKD